MNPVAAIESVRMMMDHLGEDEAAQSIESGVKRILSKGEFRARDMGGRHSTSEMGDAIKRAILEDD